MSIISAVCATPNPGPYPKGRRCSHVCEDGVRCITVLCTYTKGPRCQVHSPATLASVAEQLESLEDLMAA